MKNTTNIKKGIRHSEKRWNIRNEGLVKMLRAREWIRGKRGNERRVCREEALDKEKEKGYTRNRRGWKQGGADKRIK